jgi:calcium-translocating P-type ATPase
MAPPAHAVTADEVAARLGVNPATGLTHREAASRLVEFGANVLVIPARPPYLRLAARQLVDPLVLLLSVAAAVSFLIGDEIEGAAIAAIVLLNGALGFAQEARAERAVLALRGGLNEGARVVREGREQEIPVEEVVCGDIVVVREGDKAPADARVVTAERLEVDESALTGESAPVAKSTAAVDVEAPLAERASMVYAGTGVTRGRANIVVTATSPDTEMGRIADLTHAARPPATPLQRRLGDLARWMSVFGVGVTVVLAIALYVQGSSAHEAFLVGVAVAVATVPEGLAATVTIALSLGAQAMAARGAIARRLAAVETLGSATVIATDKTGTLTENRLRVVSVCPTPARCEDDVLAAAVLASAAELAEADGAAQVLGDPVDGAILLAARDRGVELQALLDGREAVFEVPFQPERRRMAIVYAEEPDLRVVVKGAPEVVLSRAGGGGPDAAVLDEQAVAWAEEGLRVLAIGERHLPPEVTLNDEVDAEVDPVGLVALADPLRKTASASLTAAREAGLGVRMLTGDHPATAHAIGRSLGLAEDEIYARVTPEEKLRIVEALQAGGEIVAVTGDGVNDAPALRRGDVGVAMGRSGTQAAREAADLVLTDDDFATIVAAVEEGRRIAANVRKFVAFLLSANFGELVLFAVAILAGLGAPMTVVQVLLVNVVTDGLPAVALARDPASPGLMPRGPTSKGSLLPRAVWAALGAVGIVLGLTALIAYEIGGGDGGGRATTMAFVTVALSELALVFGCRSAVDPAWRAPRNPYLVAGVVASAGILAASIYFPAFQEAAGTVSLGASDLALVAILSLVPLCVLESAKGVWRRALRSSP